MVWEPRDLGGGKADLERQWAEFRQRLRRFTGFRGWTPIIGLLIALLLAWQGFYIVAPDEQGVVKRFGRVVRITPPGPHFKIPLIESVLIPKVTKLHRIEVGFRSNIQGGTTTVPREALMLTGDENILSVELIVQFRIKDAQEFLFNVADMGETIMKATEAAIRQVIGQSHIDEALTTGKAEIQESTQALLQQILDDYHAGVHVAAIQLQDVDPPEQVVAAFKDVASAKEDKEKLINEAQGYRNDIIPKAKGEAAQTINQAQAYAQSRVRRAEGEADRFNKTLKEYQQAKPIIRKRIYLETMEAVLPGMNKVIIDGKVGDRTLPYLPLTREPKPSGSRGGTTP
ncbi:MAG: FtsH protease activity modulator HflK [Nitrospirota bacterium]